METIATILGVENAVTSATQADAAANIAAVNNPTTTIRKKRAPRHDFKDGCGKVAAHKHDYGKGWVADTARVDDSVYVGPRASVFQFAQVRGGSRLEGNARVFGHARISENVLIKHNAAVSGQAEIIGAIFLADDVVVQGNAKISGECTLRQKVEVHGRAAIFNSVLSGDVVVANDAMVLRSNIAGAVRVTDGAVLSNASVNGFVILKNFVHIAHSTLNYTTQRTDIPQPYICIEDFCLIAARSSICTPVILRGHVTVLSTEFRGRLPDNTTPAVLNGTAVISGQMFNEYNNIALFADAVQRAEQNPANRNGTNVVTAGVNVPQIRTAAAMLPGTGRRLIKT